MALKGYYPSEPFSLMISLKYGAYLVALEVWKFDFHQLVFKRCPKQKGYQWKIGFLMTVAKSFYCVNYGLTIIASKV